MKTFIKVIAWLMIIGGIGYGGFLCLIFLAPMSHVGGGGNILGEMIRNSFLVAFGGWLITIIIGKFEKTKTTDPKKQTEQGASLDG